MVLGSNPGVPARGYMPKPRRTSMVAADFWKNYPGPKIPVTLQLQLTNIGYSPTGPREFSRNCFLICREDTTVDGRVIKTSKAVDSLSWIQEREFLRYTRRWKWDFHIEGNVFRWKSMRDYMEGIKDWRFLRDTEVPTMKSLESGVFPSIPDYCNKCQQMLCSHM